MAYFPNGSSVQAFKGEFCHNCKHWKIDVKAPERGEGCPIMDAHILADACEVKKADILLDLLIPESPKPNCMFYEAAR